MKVFLIHITIVAWILYLVLLEAFITQGYWFSLIIFSVINIILTTLCNMFITKRDIVKASKDNWLSKLLED